MSQKKGHIEYTIDLNIQRWIYNRFEYIMINTYLQKNVPSSIMDVLDPICPQPLCRPWKLLP